jgi:hypothetical protein
MQTSVTFFVSVNKHLARSQQDSKSPAAGLNVQDTLTAWSQPAVNSSTHNSTEES